MLINKNNSNVVSININYLNRRFKYKGVENYWIESHLDQYFIYFNQYIKYEERIIYNLFKNNLNVILEINNQNVNFNNLRTSKFQVSNIKEKLSDRIVHCVYKYFPNYSIVNPSDGIYGLGNLDQSLYPNNYALLGLINGTALAGTTTGRWDNVNWKTQQYKPTQLELTVSIPQEEKFFWDFNELKKRNIHGLLSKYIDRACNLNRNQPDLITDW